MNEIERKFLIANNSWRDNLSEKHRPMLIRQMYIINKPEVAMRIQYRERIDPDERKAAVSIKTPREGLIRVETELEYDPLHAVRLMETLRNDYPSITKKRLFVDYPHDDLYWEIDEFSSGLLLAEIEVPSEDYELELPDWIGKEVTDDHEYYNANLVNRLNG